MFVAVLLLCWSCRIALLVEKQLIELFSSCEKSAFYKIAQRKLKKLPSYLRFLPLPLQMVISSFALVRSARHLHRQNICSYSCKAFSQGTLYLTAHLMWNAVLNVICCKNRLMSTFCWDSRTISRTC